jgi:hypothetical protein
LAFSYWVDYLGFITEGKLAAIFIKPSLGVSNWPVIYIINYMPAKHHKFSGTVTEDWRRRITHIKTMPSATTAEETGGGSGRGGLGGRSLQRRGVGPLASPGGATQGDKFPRQTLILFHLR